MTGLSRASAVKHFCTDLSTDTVDYFRQLATPQPWEHLLCASLGQIHSQLSEVAGDSRERFIRVRQHYVVESPARELVELERDRIRRLEDEVDQVLVSDALLNDVA